MGDGLSNLAAQQATALQTYASQTASGATSQAQAATGGALASVTSGINKILTAGGASVASGINAKLTDPLFITGGDDKLTSTDIYGKKNATGINTLIESLTGMITGPFQAFRSGDASGVLGAIASMTNVFSNGTGGFSVDTRALTERVLGAAGNSLSAGPLKDAILGATGVNPELYDRIYQMTDSAYQNYRSGSFNDARSLYSMVAQIAQNPALSQIIDVGAQTSVMAGVMNEAIRMGIPDSIAAMIDRANDESSRGAMKLTAAAAIDSGDVKTVSLFLDHLGGGQLTAEVPDAAARFLTAYQLAYNTNSTQYPAKQQELLALLDRIDPDWLIRKRGAHDVSSLGALSMASVDAQLLLSLDPALLIALEIAPTYPPENLFATARAMYPLIAV